jgi:two-component system response regulator RstA
MREGILLVEDDPKLAELMRDFLVGHGYPVEIVGSGEEAVARIQADPPDLVVLDLMLPGLDGMEVCRRARAYYRGPILILTARGEEIDEVLGLQAGADDYVAKPVRPLVLLARIRALLRRASPKTGSTRLGNLLLDPNTRTATLEGVALELTTSEWELLAYLAARAGTVVERDELHQAMRGFPWDGVDRSIDLRVSRLRKKLGDEVKPARLLKSIRGTGYLLVPEL